MLNKNFTPLNEKLRNRNNLTSKISFPEKEPMGEFIMRFNNSDLENSENIEKKDNSKNESKPILTEVDNDKKIELHPELKKAGLQAIENGSLDSKHIVHLPISDEKIISGLKQPPTSTSRWLSEYAVLLLKRAHLALKIVHGKVVRIIKK